MKKNRLPNAVVPKSARTCGLWVKCLVLMAVMCSHLTAWGQLKQRFTLEIKEAYLSELFVQIEKQSKYSFVYNVADIQALGKKNFRCVNAELRSILAKCLDNTPLKYEVTDTHIVISRRDGQTTPSLSESDKRRIEIEGTVTDEGHEPLAGVAVRMKGANIGVSTDAAGHYRLVLSVEPEKEVTIVYSFVGMETREVKYTGQKEIDIRLKEAVGMMDEVVVQTGYQTLDRRKITSAVTTLKMDDIRNPAIGTVDMMLEGHVPGMIFMQNSGTVGATPRLRIRGTSTVLGNQEPLWVVDGIVQTDPVNIDPNQLNDLDFVNLLGNAISGINPEDIEQIDILKDASATAIYGARAGNGVIVVTTKKGKPGPPSVNYSFSASFSRRPHYSDKFVNMMNSKERVAYSRELIENHQAYGFIKSWVGYEGAMKDYYDGNISFEEMQRRVGYYEGLNTDWFDLLTQNAFTNKHTVSVSGGSSIFRYYASAGLSNEQGNVKGERNRTYSTNINVSANFKRFSMRFGVNASLQDRKYVPTELGVMNYAYNTNRAIPAYEDGELYYYNKYYARDDNNSFRTPFNIINEMNNSFQKNKTYTTTLTATLGYKILDCLNFDATLSYTMGGTTQQLYYNENTYYAAVLRGEGEREFGSTVPANLMPYGGELDETKTDRSNYTIRGQLTFNKDLDAAGKHNLSAAAGAEVSSSKYNNFNQIFRGYMEDRGMGMGRFDPELYPQYYDWYYTTDAARGVHKEDLTNMVSGYVTVSYDYDNRYMFNVNARADASNQFGSRSNEKILPIWSFSGRWNIKNDLLPNSKVISDMSIRASYGIQGNMLSSESSRLVMSRTGEVNANNEYLSHIYRYPNPDLKWEKTHSTNVTFDFGLFRNRISGSFSYYYKKTNDAFLNKNVSNINGVTSYVVNRGTIENQGIELGLSFVAIDRTRRGNPNGFRWTIIPELGQTLNKLLNKVSSKTLKDNFTYTDFLNGSVEIPGKPLNSFYSYRFTGLSPIDGRPTFYGMDQETMEEEYKKYTTEKDKIYLMVMDYSGNRVPTIQGGLMNTFSYKRFTLSVNLAYSFGAKVRLLQLYPDVYRGYGTIAPQPEMNARKELLDRWRAPGDELYTNIPGTISGSAFTETLSESATGINWWKNASYRFADNIWQMYDNSDLRVVSGDYVRLQSLSFRYLFPEQWIKGAGLNSLSLGFYATNLFTICSKKLNGQDPTTQSGSSAVINMSNRPTFSFNLSVSF